MKSLIVGLALALIPAPAGASELYGSLGGIIAGEVLCSLRRYGVSDQAQATELKRIVAKLTARDLLDLDVPSEAESFTKASAQMLRECPLDNRPRNGLH